MVLTKLKIFHWLSMLIWLGAFILHLECNHYVNHLSDVTKSITDYTCIVISVCVCVCVCVLRVCVCVCYMCVWKGGEK